MDTKKSACRSDREFEENAVALVRSGRSATEVACDLGVSTRSLNRWVALTRAGVAPSEPKTFVAESLEQRELHRLQQENDYLRRQRDILKKLWASCAIRDDSRLSDLMETTKAEFSTREMAAALEVFKNGFHAHRHKAKQPRRQRDAELRPLVRPVLSRVSGVQQPTPGCGLVGAWAALLQEPDQHAHALGGRAAQAEASLPAPRHHRRHGQKVA